MVGWRGSGLFVVVTMLLLAGLAAGCGGAGEQDGDGTQEEGESLSWVPFGPNDPDIPTPSWPAYNALASGECPALESYTAEQDLGTFGRAMVAVCFAAVEGQQEQWDDLAAAAGGDPSTLANDCLARLVSDLIDRALEWHEQNPGQTPDVQFVRVAGRTQCGEQSAGEEGTDGEDGDPGFTEEPEPTAAPEVSGESARRSGGTNR